MKSPSKHGCIIPANFRQRPTLAKSFHRCRQWYTWPVQYPISDALLLFAPRGSSVFPHQGVFCFDAPPHSSASSTSTTSTYLSAYTALHQPRESRCTRGAPYLTWIIFCNHEDEWTIGKHSSSGVLYVLHLAGSRDNVLTTDNAMNTMMHKMLYLSLLLLLLLLLITISMWHDTDEITKGI